MYLWLWLTGLLGPFYMFRVLLINFYEETEVIAPQTTSLDLAFILWQSSHSLSNIIPEQCHSFSWTFPKEKQQSLNKFTQPLKASALTLTIPEITPAEKIKAP